ncbi:gamma-glutamylcyclotransferase family protein [Aquirufa regiilacus]|uniref:Gamma-glutamylcyclotransferase family protein n=1 Tax=Aquirufa regiilacus TaxID=3024868 RepID=A0ABU3TTH1_9BACT|nr:gamma-glutamylcyclotransferase family protein [Aquirufa sp. LEOWEIH-7C]MDU0808962.1 gamma-glutamylcyclotransferase family protein [Aquirufa sp. LEOWEIH-7C]
MSKATIKVNSTTTLSDLEAFLQNKDKEGLANFVYKRLSERYILPLIHVDAQYKNGFNILANSCLLIEAFETFRTGNIEKINSQSAFESFFNREESFKSFDKHSIEFYKHVRCGILHQGETTGNWRITRRNDAELFNDFVINANEFLDSLKQVLLNYKQELIQAEWEDIIWVNCLRKVKQILLNCSVYYFAYGSNMNLTRLEERVGQNIVRLAGKALLKDYELKFNKLKSDESGAANVMLNRYSHVEGLLYEFDPSNSTFLEKLDRYEGVRSKDYIRKLMNVEIDGIEVLAYVYVAHRDKIKDGILPSKEYLDHLLCAKVYLSESYFSKLLNQKTQ